MGNLRFVLLVGVASACHAGGVESVTHQSSLARVEPAPPEQQAPEQQAPERQAPEPAQVESGPPPGGFESLFGDVLVLERVDTEEGRATLHLRAHGVGRVLIWIRDVTSRASRDSLHVIVQEPGPRTISPAAEVVQLSMGDTLELQIPLSDVFLECRPASAPDALEDVVGALIPRDLSGPDAALARNAHGLAPVLANPRWGSSTERVRLEAQARGRRSVPAGGYEFYITVVEARGRITQRARLDSDPDLAPDSQVLRRGDTLVLSRQQVAAIGGDPISPLEGL